jgi:hypothetical protein
MVNQREERQALNMISNINNKKTDLLNLAPSSQCSQASKVSNIQPRSEFTSIQQQTQKRKNFKNMFYSPKGGREAFTEPHSKVPSQAHTKQHSPVRMDSN